MFEPDWDSGVAKESGRLRAIFVVRMRSLVLNISEWTRQQGKHIDV